LLEPEEASQQSTSELTLPLHLKWLNRRDAIKIKSRKRDYARGCGLLKQRVTALSACNDDAIPLSILENRESAFVRIPEIADCNVGMSPCAIRAQFAAPLHGFAKVRAPGLLI
jgi:hypothetical protein